MEIYPDLSRKIIEQLEKELKENFTKLQKAERDKREEIIKEFKKKKIEQRMGRITKHEGRIEMRRAPKQQKKKQEKKNTEDEGEINQYKYLGMLVEKAANKDK